MFSGTSSVGSYTTVLLAYCEEDLGGHCWKVAVAHRDGSVDVECFWELAADAIFN